MSDGQDFLWDRTTNALGVTERPAVFHVVLWIEGERDITMSLGLEGSIATREIAERCAAIYRECLSHETISEISDPQKVFRSCRVGILEMPAPDSRLKHPAPRDDAEEIFKEIRARVRRQY